MTAPRSRLMRRWPPSLERVGLIISDMGRREEGRYVAQAGAILLKAALQAGCEEPFIVYSSARYAARNDEED